MTHASDLAKLAETFIDRYLVECDARREAEAALAKSEEERATQSANLAAAMAEVATLKADRDAADRASQNNAQGWKAAVIRAEQAEGRIVDLKERNDWQAGFLRKIGDAIGFVQETDASLWHAVERVVAERDALRRAEAGKGLPPATLIRDAMANAGALCSARDCEKVRAFLVEKWTPDEAKAAGEGRVDASPVYMAIPREQVPIGALFDGFTDAEHAARHMEHYKKGGDFLGRTMTEEESGAKTFPVCVVRLVTGRTLAQPADAGQPTSPAKPADRYVAMEADRTLRWKGYRGAWFDSLSNAQNHAMRMNRGESRDSVRWDLFNDRAPHHVAVIVDTQSATAPQPSPLAVGVDMGLPTRRLIEIAGDETAAPVDRWAAAMERWKRVDDYGTDEAIDLLTEAGESMRRALTTIGAQPLVALTEEALRASMVRSAVPDRDASALFADLTASGPVAIPGLDRDALIAARTCVMAHGGPGMSRMVQAIDGVIRAGDAGKADAVTVEEIVNAFDDEVDNQPRTTISEDLRTVLTANVGKVIAGAGKP